MNNFMVKSLDTNKTALLIDCHEQLERGEFVVVESEEKGEDVVRVLGSSKKSTACEESYKFLRKADGKEMEVVKRNAEESKKAFKTCKELISKHRLNMHLLKAYIPLNSKKIFFYYTADERIDFRGLVKDMARILKKRIEMRQVGVRDAIQILGWVGICGEVPCCIRFMENFESISLKDIEDQNLPLSPSKFTGPCGRLVCCMAFERENYKVKELLPQKGREFCFEGECYTVIEVDPISYKITAERESRIFELSIGDVLPDKFRTCCSGCCGCEKSRALAG